ncbi:carboxylesterase family protein [Shewanella avicenniae]|uniref:Carboxylic ester hydrolase n=1 Tax=Shewanella avicenniae TaxID=2814294 RepID=A0ABX7QRT2_9GAMM|nr:carboxylesterase family protein [Shewanella avicenniae]QSX34169.1 carboxylesterase family protein [Shewanella avicenniae]
MSLFSLNQAQQPVANTQLGQVAGIQQEGLAIFKGIPYAAPPIGELRWQAPAAAEAWQGIKQAVEFAPACPQLSSAFTDVPGQRRDEDCLYLNVWSPATDDNKELPVIVWIHGGGYSFGSTAQPIFNGENLAKKGVVFVSIAYRLGPLGFFAHPDLSAESTQGSSGNYGLLDQIAALKWVQQNIHHFGGLADNVTIMGESAGAISVSLLAASPLARGLFHKAIAESGASFGNAVANGNIGQSVKPLPAAEAMGSQFSATAGLSLAELRALPAEKLLANFPRVSELVLESSWPAFDGYVIADDPVTLYENSQQNDTPILIGSNAAEGSLFVQQTTLAQFQQLLQAQFGADSDIGFNAYPASNDAEALTAQQHLFRDLAFAWHSWTWAKLQSKTGTGAVYSYYFNHTPPAFPNMPDLGPTHAAEMAFVFDLLMPPRAWTAEDQQLADTMSSYWVNFAKTGNPNGAGLPVWPAWDNAAPQVLHFTPAPTVGAVANLEQLEAIDLFFQHARG